MKIKFWLLSVMEYFNKVHNIFLNCCKFM